MNSGAVTVKSTNQRMSAIDDYNYLAAKIFFLFQV